VNTRHILGASGESYDLGSGGLDALRRQHDLLVKHFGSLKVVIITIAAILDTEKSASPSGVLALLHAAQEMEY